MKTLDYDKARCAGRMDFDPDGKWCEQRNTCQRFLAFSGWDREADVLSYRGIAVEMGREDCTDKIEAGPLRPTQEQILAAIL